MPLSENAIDVLDQLPQDCVLYDDGKEFVKVKVPTNTTIFSEMISRWNNVTVNFKTRILTICVDNTIPPSTRIQGSPRKSGLKPETEGERQAAAMADKMSCVDLDCLVPSFSLSSTPDHTTLKIGRLLRVNDDLMRLELPDTAEGYAYCMRNKETVVFFPSDKKRKSRD